MVAEGYTDVLALAAAGVEACVACMGTSLTSEQLRALARTAPEVRLCFDADEAGQAAAWRTVEAAEGIPIRLAAAQLPNGQDPGDLAASPNEQTILRRVVEASRPLVACLIEFRVSHARSVDERRAALGQITELLRTVDDAVEKDEGVRVATSGLGLSRATEERAQRGDSGSARHASRAWPGASSRASEELERRLLILAVAAARARGPLPGPAPAGEPGRRRPPPRRVALLAAGEDPERWPPDAAPPWAWPCAPRPP